MSDPGVLPGGSAHEAARAAEAARLSEVRKAAIYDAAPDCIIAADHEGRITEFNLAAERTFGHRREAVLGMPLACIVGEPLADVIVPPSVRTQYRGGRAHRLASDDAQLPERLVETTAVRADGSEFPVELSVRHIALDRLPCFVAYLRDTTTRRSTDDERRRGAAYLAQAQRLTQTGLWVWNPFTDCGVASENVYRMLGLAPDEKTAHTLAEFTGRVHPEDRPALDRAIETAIQERSDFEVSYRIVLADGAVRHLHVLSHPLLTPAGELREFIGTVVDVTDRKRAEEAEAQRAREAALRSDVSGVLTRSDSMRGMLQGCAEAIVRRLDVAFARIWTLSRGSRTLELQASAGQYTRLDGSYARVRVGDLKIGLIALERAPHLTNDVLADPRIVNKEWARREGMVAFAGYPLVVEERVVGVMAMFARHVLEPETLDALGSIATAVAQGIERKRSEEQLRRSEAYLAEGQRLSHTASWAWDLRTSERFWSAEMFRIHGFEPADSPPPLETVLRRVHPDDVAAVRRAIDDALRRARKFRIGARILVEGRPIRYVEAFGHPVRDDDGRVVELIGTVIDVTARRRADQRLRRAIEARYEAVLAERTRIARDMHDGLLQDVTGIAPQLRALLPHVRTAPDTAAETLARTVEQTERTSREARRAVAGMRASPDPGDLVKAAEDAARRAAAYGSVALAVTVTGRPRPMSAEVCDAASSIVHEAVTNVLRHADAHAVELSLAFARRKLRLSVRDDGRGLSLHASDRSGHFGLVGMRERAAGLGASLSVRSAPGGGTIVALDVPYPR